MASPPDDAVIRDEESVPATRARARPRRPLPVVVLALAAGLGTGLLLDGWSPWLPIGGALVFAAGGLLIRREAWATALMLAAVMATGAAWMQHAAGFTASDDLRSHFSRPRQFADITGVVITPPLPEEVDERGLPVWVFELRSETIRAAAGPVPVRGVVRVRYEAAGDEVVRYGDRWRLRGPVRLDDRSVVRRQGLVGSMTVSADRAECLASDAGNPFVAWCYSQRERAARVLGYGLEEGAVSAGFTRALLLGSREQVSRPVHDAFARTGTLHILALSGMHVGILVFILVILLKSAGIPRTYWVFFFLPFLTTYTVATGAAASMVRALVMAIVFFLANFMRRQPDPPTSLAMAALLILVFDPLQLFDFGFILSFVVVGGLLALAQPVAMMMRRASVEGDPWMEPETSWWSAAGRGLWARVVDLFSVSVAAWVVSLPLIAAIFNLISPSALLVNLPLIPMSFVIMLTGCLSLITGPVAPPVASIFNHANDLFCDALMALVDVSARVPGSHFYVKAWPWYVILAWFVLVLAWLITRGGKRALAAAGLAAMLVFSVTQRHFSSRVEAVMIPSGDAAVMLVDGPGNRAMLFDTGAAFRSRALVEVLRSRGIAGLDEVWLTRATSDAYGGLDELLDAIPARVVFAPAAPPAQHHYLARQQAWRERWGEHVIQNWPVDRYRAWGDDLLLRVLFPPAGEMYRNARASAMMLHLSHGHRSLLFMSRADVELERLAAALPVDWQAETLLVGLIESSAALSDAWLDLVTPASVVFTPRAFDRAREGVDPLLRRLNGEGHREVITIEDREPWTVTL